MKTQRDLSAERKDTLAMGRTRDELALSVSSLPFGRIGIPMNGSDVHARLWRGDS